MLRTLFVAAVSAVLLFGCSIRPDLLWRERGTLAVDVDWTAEPAWPNPRVTLDGDPVGEAPGGETVLRLPSGEHEVGVYSAGFLPQSQTLVVLPGNHHYVHFLLEPTAEVRAEPAAEPEGPAQ